jgi:ATP-dependent helicase HrpB
MAPIDPLLPQVVDTLRQHPVVVLHAPTGAGKTTRLPPFLLDHPVVDGAVWCLEPRRIAARAAARFVSGQRGGRPGDEIGWHVRFEPRFGERTRLLFLTDGVAVRRLQADPFLEGVGVVVFDEFHERSLGTDLALAMVRRVQREIRDDLRIVVMSATLDATRVAEALGGAPVLRSEGRSHPVDIRYLDRPDTDRLEVRAARGVRQALDAVESDILAFLPGVGEIRATARRLEGIAADVLPLYGDLPAAEQDRALRVGPRRRVVLATNVAETSLTLDGIAAVVDTGVARILRHDPGTGLDRLALEPISRAAADQRAGRAGRQGPGVALRWWTRAEDRTRPGHDTPALQRTDLSAPLLQLRAWGEPDPVAFPWIAAPPSEALAAGEALLRHLGLVDGSGLTALGRAAAELPVHPRLAILLVEAARAGHPGLGARAAAILSERDPFRRAAPGDPPPPTSNSDLLDRLHALEHGDPRLRPGARKAVERVARRLLRTVRSLSLDPDPVPDPEVAVRRALARAWSDRIARRHGPGRSTGVLVGGRGVDLSRSAVREAELVACLAVHDGARTEARVHLASAVDPAWLPTTTETVLRFDPDRGQVVARRERRLEDLILESHPAPLPEDTAVAACLQEALEAHPDRLPWEAPEVAGLLARLAAAAEHLPERGFPRPGPAFRRGVIPLAVIGHRGLDTLDAAALARAVRTHLGFHLARELDDVAPTHLVVPSGSRRRLEWTADGPPVLAVRMQEMFGCTDTPRVLGGRVPVRLHLLAPNGRPAQITDDLGGFWVRTWPEVRKDLRARYPKHAWPEDGATARPLRGTPRRGRRS